MKGSYILILNLENNKTIKVGKLRNIDFKKGIYVYVGSGLNSLEKRVQRHFSTQKKTHWHIDYLLAHAKIVNAFLNPSNEKEECIIARSFDKLEKIKGFGCSDCKCDSHLFYGSLKDIIQIIDKFKL